MTWNHHPLWPRRSTLSVNKRRISSMTHEWKASLQRKTHFPEAFFKNLHLRIILIGVCDLITYKYFVAALNANIIFSNKIIRFIVIDSSGQCFCTCFILSRCRRLVVVSCKCPDLFHDSSKDQVFSFCSRALAFVFHYWCVMILWLSVLCTNFISFATELNEL